MSNAPPAEGTVDWGDDLNLYLTGLQNRIAALETQLDTVESRVDDIEDRPEYVYNSYAWQFSNAAPPATGNQIRFDSADLTLATVIDIRKIDSDGGDRTPVLQKLDEGAKVSVSDWDNAALGHTFLVSGVPTMDATNAQIPVTWQSGSGTIPNAKVNVAFLITLEV